MKLSTLAESWIRRYERGFARHLPLRGRKDIQKEFRSHVLDDLEEKFGTATVDADDMKEYLAEMGSPRQKAAPYRQDGYLIAPELFPLFKMVTSIVFIVLTIVLMATQAFSLGKEGVSLLGVLGIFGNTFQALVSTLGTMVIIFYLIQYFIPKTEWEDPFEDEAWKPDMLPKEEYPNKIKLGDPIAAIVFSFIAVVIFTAFSDQVGIHNFSEEGHRFMPILAPGFWTLMPLFLFRWGLEMAFNIVLIIFRRWNLPLRLTDIALRAFSLGIIVYILQKGWRYLFLSDALSSLWVKNLDNILSILFPIGMGLAILGSVVEIIKKVIALYKEPQLGEED